LVFEPVLETVPWFMPLRMPNLPGDTVCLGKGDVNNVAAGNRIKVVFGDELMKAGCPGEKAGAVCTGRVAAFSYVCRTCPCNFHNAMCNRHAKAAPPRTAAGKAMQGRAHSAVNRHLEEVRLAYQKEYEHWSSMLSESEMLAWKRTLKPKVRESFERLGITTYNRWIAKWPTRRRMIMLHAARRYFVRGGKHKQGEAPDKLASFVKFEGAHKRPSKARAIQGYDDLEDQMRLGPYVYSLQCAFAHVFRDKPVTMANSHNKCTSVYSCTVGCAMNADDYGAWIEKHQSSTHWYERDGKNWDASVDEYDTKKLLAFYRRFFPDWVLDMLRKGGELAVGKHLFRGKDGNVLIKTRVHYTTRSGHLDTTLRNSYLNLVKTLGALSESQIAAAAVAVMGDDMLTGSAEVLDCRALMAAESAMSMEPEARVLKDWRDTSFISGTFAPVETGYTFIPQPGRMLARLLWTTSNVPGNLHLEHARGCVAGLTPAFKELPVIREFFRPYMGGTAPVGDYWKNKKQFESKAVDHIDPAWFYQRYGLSEGQVDQCERMLQGLPTSAVLYSDPVVGAILTRDLADIEVRNLSGYGLYTEYAHS
jgi:hypothetical protein